jgi:hypothetical protein
LEDPDDLRFGEAGLFHVSLLGQKVETHNFNLGYFPTSGQPEPQDFCLEKRTSLMGTRHTPKTHSLRLSEFAPTAQIFAHLISAEIRDRFAKRSADAGETLFDDRYMHRVRFV